MQKHKKYNFNILTHPLLKPTADYAAYKNSHKLK
jgi:hypothetical protein